MPDSISEISVLPRMREPGEKGRTFRLRWILDLVSDSSRCYVNLLFENVSSGFTIVDSIPPELLSYFTVGSLCTEGRMLERSPGGTPLPISITSGENNIFQEAQYAISDEDFDLSLGGSTYSDISRKQLCFVQEVAGMKVVIPSFVIAGRYYFMSTSLREVILSRHLDSLYHSCSLDETRRHATIHLKRAGNQGDAKAIARFALDPFAKARLDLCKNVHYGYRRRGFQRMKVDFPVKQELTLRCCGELLDRGESGKTFLVLHIAGDNSQFPFDSLDVLYQPQDSMSDTQSQQDAGAFPVSAAKHTGNMVLGAPSRGQVRHFLESTPPLENENENLIRVTKIPVDSAVSSESNSHLHFEKERVDLSAQMADGYDQLVSKVEIREKTEEALKSDFTLEMFVQMVTHLRDDPVSVRSPNGEQVVTIGDFELVQSVAPGSKLTLKESYDRSAENRRRYATVRFTCERLFVCLVEIDQRQIPGGGCSTRVMVSRKAIGEGFANICIDDYLEGNLLASTIERLKDEGIALLTKKHPKPDDLGAQDLWRAKLIEKILQNAGG
ncbi:hypothetical protein [Citrifermentans bremense]|uniref:hypothetical protein n=1 Tax=Citrifermentans bremense TaxID=60035 RepID=UPI00041B5FD3|nr:hypothetical protein [Citrifermentans bremense]